MYAKCVLYFNVTSVVKMRLSVLLGGHVTVSEHERINQPRVLESNENFVFK